MVLAIWFVSNHIEQSSHTSGSDSLPLGVRVLDESYLRGDYTIYTIPSTSEDFILTIRGSQDKFNLLIGLYKDHDTKEFA